MTTQIDDLGASALGSKWKGRNTGAFLTELSVMSTTLAAEQADAMTEIEQQKATVDTAELQMLNKAQPEEGRGTPSSMAPMTLSCAFPRRAGKGIHSTSDARDLFTALVTRAIYSQGLVMRNEGIMWSP